MGLRENLEEQGYVVIMDLVTHTERIELEQTCARTIAKTRSGEWKLRRTAGRQFPPFDESNPDSWGVQHLMHPDLNEPVFAEWYTSELIVKTAAELLDCPEDSLQMELFNLLINPLNHDFALRWHRDDVKETASEDEEREALTVRHYGIQWNTALYKDECLYIVPRSHKVPRTPKQRALSSTSNPPDNPLDMPGAMKVVLQPGETVFYNNNILHCATYDSSVPRATLHASMGDTRGGSNRARNVLQHGLDWMREERFADGLDSKRGRPMLERLIQLRNAHTDEIMFSQEN